MRFKQNQRSQKSFYLAFTLIELLEVIPIIAAMLLPALGKAKQAAMRHTGGVIYCDYICLTDIPSHSPHLTAL